MLKGNNFEYDEELYSQELGTAIGALFACAYTGVAMRGFRGRGFKTLGGEVRGWRWNN